MVKSKKPTTNLENKYILYVVFLISFVTIVGYLLKENYGPVVAFVVIAVILRAVTCNMIIVLGVPLVSVIVWKARLKEGLTNEKKKEDENPAKKKKKKSQKESMVAQSNPAPVDYDEADDVDRVDFATTMKQAYQDLQGVLDKDGIKALSKETQQLVEQQKVLMNSLNTMAPILKDAKSSLKSFNMPDIKKMIAGLKQN